MYHKQLRECKTKSDVIERLKRNANLVKERTNMFDDKRNQVVQNHLTYGELENLIKKYVEQEQSVNEQEEDEFDIDELMREFENENAEELGVPKELQDKEDEQLDEIIRDLENELSMKKGFLNERTKW